MTMVRRFLLCVFAAVLSLVATTRIANASPAREWVADASVVLGNWYNPATGLYRTTNWWNAANALQAELVSSQLLGNDVGVRHAATSYAANIRGGFLNEYYDDEGWWALTWVQGYDLTGDERYLRVAKSLFVDMVDGWDDTCGGGVWWSKARGYKNAIPNELFLSLAAKLALRSIGDEAAGFRDWALRSWRWFLASGMLNSSSLINDGLGADCRNNGGITWTYNQGVILGGLADLARLTGDSSHLDTAGRIAHAALDTLTDSAGVLHEPCEPNCGADGPQFKGIFVRNLADLHEAAPSDRYTDFVRYNADSLWHTDRSSANELGLVWSGPFDSADASRQSSALDCLNAALRMGQ